MLGALNYKAVARVMGRLVGVEGLLLSIPLAWLCLAAKPTGPALRWLRRRHWRFLRLRS